jgi:hypothetical protein
LPGARYTVTGAVENEIIASSQGEASITVDINGRTEITVSPRESNA